MWERRSRTSTFLSSWVATRSATVSPKKPEPTTTRSAGREFTPRRYLASPHGSLCRPGLPRHPALVSQASHRPARHPVGTPTGPTAPPRVVVVAANPADAHLRVVAVTYSPGDVLEEFIESVATATKRPVEIVLADNGSTDGSVEAAAAKYPNVTLLRTGGNIGY